MPEPTPPSGPKDDKEFEFPDLHPAAPEASQDKPAAPPVSSENPPVPPPPPGPKGPNIFQKYPQAKLLAIFIAVAVVLYGVRKLRSSREEAEEQQQSQQA